LAWSGHHGCTCYHPLFVFNQFGDLERCALRAGTRSAGRLMFVTMKPTRG
jgi:hypothetical protein